MNESAAPKQQAGGYGYAEEAVNESDFIFGLNAGNAFLTKFEWTNNGGKDGAELEALDIVFTVDGKARNYRKFPVKKAYGKDAATGQQVEITDPSHPAFIAEQKSLSAVLVHIIGCFATKEEIQSALATAIPDFKTYCKILASVLPADFTTKPLDIFAQYQWAIKGEATKTYLEFPKNMKHGRWIGASVKPIDKWEKQVKQNPSDSEIALRYIDADGNVHPFSRNGWFMNSNFAVQQKDAPSAGAAQMNQNPQNSGSGDW